MDGNDWRLTNQEKYLKNLVFTRRKFDGVDHAHSEFCWEKFGYNKGNLMEGYCSEDNKYWVCETCFEDFKDSFGFKIVSNEKTF